MSSVYAGNLQRVRGKEGKHMEGLNFRRKRRECCGNLFSVYVMHQNGSLLYKLAAGSWPGPRPRLVCPAGCFPERACPGEGHLPAGAITGQEEGPGRRGRGGAGMEKMLAGSRKETSVGWMKSSGGARRRFPLATLCPGERLTTAISGMRSEASVVQRSESYDWSGPPGAGHYQQAQSL